MYIRIREVTSLGKENDLVLEISKSSLIHQVQTQIYNSLKVEIAHQKLYYRGKELLPNHRITDYDIKLNDVIQLLIRTDDEIKEEKENVSPNSKNYTTHLRKEAKSRYYAKGDQVDVIDSDNGSWLEAKIMKIYSKSNGSEMDENNFIFLIQMERDSDNAPLEATFDEIRPRSNYIYSRSELKVGMIVLVNYNIEKPSTTGYWYDFEIEKMTNKYIKGTLLVGKERTELKNCSVKINDEIMKIEKATLLTEKKPKIEAITLRKVPFFCNECQDDPSKKCNLCSCQVCGKKDDEGTSILCDECDDTYHLKCLKPPLKQVPTDDWYCPECKTDDSEIVKAGEDLKASKRKLKMPSHKASKFEWGKGMACVGRSKECTIVPKDHYGPIPGIEVGTCWKFRVQVSEAGVHRPHVAGIHGRETDGAYSLILSGGYEDDVDNGEEFYYTGSGGRDLSGNRRVNEQSSDQKLKRMNKALALNCNTKLNEKIGGEAIDWKNGKPVRVVRNYKLRKHSKYAPLEGNRYDGIYKVVKYYPQKGKSGFIVWRYLLRRDDPTPPPWSKNGKEFPVTYPPGHIEALKNKPSTKRKNSSGILSLLTSKKIKIEPFQIDEKIGNLISLDKVNEKLWLECKEMLDKGRAKFMAKVEELFMCVCCQELLYEPVTITCKHNICRACLVRAFDSEIYVCPYCRKQLGKNFNMKINKNLGEILKLLYPGYEISR